MLTTHNYSSLSHLTQPKLLLTVFMPLYPQYLSGWLPTSSLSIHQKPSFSSSFYQPNSLNFIFQILHFLINYSITPVESARNLGIIFDSNLSFDKHISNLSKACYFHIRDLRRIRPTLDFDTARTIATSLVHSKLDYCNSLYYNLPQSQLKRLQAIQNSLARCVTSSSRFQHITPGLKSLHWLKVEQRIQYKLISLTYSSLQHNNPLYLRRLLTLPISH